MWPETKNGSNIETTWPVLFAIKFFVDPNDKTNIAGIYDGCSVIANDTSRNGYAEYDKDNDNRGMAEAGVSIFPNLNINGKPTTSKTGIFLEDIPSQKTKIVSSSNSIAKVRISKNKKSIKVGFVVSRQPGDNYRIVANVDNNFLENLRNEDQHDKLRIVDKNVASATGKTGVLESWENYTSNILTIWRILHYESDEMEDGFSFDTNSEVITITNF